MAGIQAIAGVSNALFVVALLLVGGRLLWLARRTRGLPEAAIGGGFIAIAGLGLPLIALGGLGRVPCGEIVMGTTAAGLGAVALGVTALQVFTWRVFRADAAWAAALTALVSLAAIAVVFGALRTIAQAPPEAPPVEVAADWWMALRGLFQVWYLWTGVEATIEWRKARRRQALGLSDPVVVNRFLIWGAMGLYSTAVNVVAMVLQARGLSPISDPASALVLAANGVGVGALMILAFVPPRAYLARVRHRAAADAP